MFKVLLVVPRFLLLDLKFLLHNHVCQHLRGSNQSHSFRRNPLCKHEKGGEHRAAISGSACVLPAAVCTPATGTGMRSSPDGRTDRQLTLGDGSAALQTCFRFRIFKIKAANAVDEGVIAKISPAGGIWICVFLFFINLIPNEYITQYKKQI